MNIYTMPKRKRNYNMLTPNINNLNNEKVHYHGNIGVRINSTIGKHHPTNMMGTPKNINEFPSKAESVHKVCPEDPSNENTARLSKK